jgi:hypothetical protein
MATINLFGITPSDISAQVHNLTISDSSSPTTQLLQKPLLLVLVLMALMRRPLNTSC